jgi:hypothetical protein
MIAYPPQLAKTTCDLWGTTRERPWVLLLVEGQAASTLIASRVRLVPAPGRLNNQTEVGVARSPAQLAHSLRILILEGRPTFRIRVALLSHIDFTRRACLRLVAERDRTAVFLLVCPDFPFTVES